MRGRQQLSSPRPLATIRGPTSKGRGKEKKGRDRERDGREERKREEEGRVRDVPPPSFNSWIHQWQRQIEEHQS